MQLLNQSDPAAANAQRNALTVQSQRQAEDMIRLLMNQGQNTEGTKFTSPWQVAGQMAQTLAAKRKMGDYAGQSQALNALGAPGMDQGATPPAAAPQAPQAPAVPQAPPVNIPQGQIPSGGATLAPEEGVKTYTSKHEKYTPEVSEAIKKAAELTGNDPGFLAGLVHIESRGNPNAKTGSYIGLGQISEKEMAEISGGKGDVRNPLDNLMATGMIANRNKQFYQKQMGMEANPFDIYMMHQQGPGGYIAHLSNPDQLAWKSMAGTAEGRQKGEKWAQLAITKNGGHIGDTSQQFLNGWANRVQRAIGGDHAAFGDQDNAKPFAERMAGPGAPGPQASASPVTAPGTQPPSASGPVMPGGTPPVTPPSVGPGGASSPGGASGGTSMIERGQFISPESLVKRPPAPYTLPQIQAAVRAGVMSQADATAHYKAITEAQQPISIPFGGGQLNYDPAHPENQTYLPTMQVKPVKVGDIETQQNFWIDSQGRQHTMPGAPSGAAPSGAPPAVGALTGAGAAASGAGEPFPAGGSISDIADYGERRKIRIAGEEESAKSQATASTKMFNGIYGGITGAGDNAAHQARNIQLLREIAPDAFTGTGSNAGLALNRMAAQMGIDPKGAAPRELFNTLAARVLADQFSGMRNLAAEEGSPASRIFKAMLDIEEKANITHEDSLEGVQAKLNMLEQAGKQAIGWADKADDYVNAHGRLDPSFMKELRKVIAETKFEDVIPKAGEKKAEGGLPSPASVVRTPPAAPPGPMSGIDIMHPNTAPTNMGAVNPELGFTPGQAAAHPTTTKGFGLAGPAIPAAMAAGGAMAIPGVAPIIGAGIKHAATGVPFGAGLYGVEELIRHLMGGGK